MTMSPHPEHPARIHPSIEIGTQLTLFFRNGENFAALFAQHPDYMAGFPPPRTAANHPIAGAGSSSERSANFGRTRRLLERLK
jgi:hypothetical protein